LKKAAREYAEERGVSFDYAMSKVKHLKRGDRVRVVIHGVARWEGTVVADQTRLTLSIEVRRCSDGAVTKHPRDNIEFLERSEHRQHPKGWRKVRP
jgi:hypothetical protein